MEKLYPNIRITATNENSQATLRNLYNKEKEMKNKLSEKDFATWIIGFHDAVRITHKFPDTIFGFAEDKDTNDVSVIAFDLKPGERYAVELDEDGRPSITVDVSYLMEEGGK